jgi:hypothetical protein
MEPPSPTGLDNTLKAVQIAFYVSAGYPKLNRLLAHWRPLFVAPVSVPMNIDAKESNSYGRKVALGRQQLFKAQVGYRAVMGWMLWSERTTLSSHAREIDPNRRLSLFAGGNSRHSSFRLSSHPRRRLLPRPKMPNRIRDQSAIRANRQMVEMPRMLASSNATKSELQTEHSTPPHADAARVAFDRAKRDSPHERGHHTVYTKW